MSILIRNGLRSLGHEGVNLFIPDVKRLILFGSVAVSTFGTIDGRWMYCTVSRRYHFSVIARVELTMPTLASQG
jgi:hypothetical protein